MTKQGTLSDNIKTWGRRQLAGMASLRFGRPARKLKIIGVTGSKGKTTTTLLIYHIMRAAGMKVGCISTISAKVGEDNLDTGFHVTSPEPWDMPKYMRKMVDAGVEYLVVEATSMGLQQGRFSGVEFDAAVITNINSDHLDYHVNWENYAEAKFKIVEKVVEDGLVVLNGQHSSTDWIMNRSEQLQKQVFAAWFTRDEAENYQQSFAGMEFDYGGVRFRTRLFGQHMLENVLAAIKISSRYLTKVDIAEALRSFRTPSGRMQILQAEPYTIIVDFAHTPKSLEATLQSVQQLKPVDGRLITVFGCAGDRDPVRREMGFPASKYSKLVILTAEDPRQEPLVQINDQIFSHADAERSVLVDRYGSDDEYRRTNLENMFTKLDRIIENGDVPFVAFDEMSTQSRADAIEFALRYAKSNDVVLITGKGHEQSLCFGDTEFEWSDQRAIDLALKNIASTNSPRQDEGFDVD